MNLPDDEFTLRRELRELAREREPRRELWGAIAARIEALDARAAPRRSRARWSAVALVASMLLAAVLVWRVPTMHDDASSASIRSEARGMAPTATANDLLLREAEAVTLEYRLALQPFEHAPLPRPIAAAVIELDASAEQIRGALRADPQATFLLERLRHTYERRLQLTQRATLG